MHPTGAGEKRQPLGSRNQNGIDQQGQRPVLQTVGTEQHLKLQHSQQARSGQRNTGPAQHNRSPSVALP